MKHVRLFKKELVLFGGQRRPNHHHLGATLLEEVHPPPVFTHLPLGLLGLGRNHPDRGRQPKAPSGRGLALE